MISSYTYLNDFKHINPNFTDIRPRAYVYLENNGISQSIRAKIDTGSTNTVLPIFIRNKLFPNLTRNLKFLKDVLDEMRKEELTFNEIQIQLDKKLRELDIKNCEVIKISAGGRKNPYISLRTKIDELSFTDKEFPQPNIEGKKLISLINHFVVCPLEIDAPKSRIQVGMNTIRFLEKITIDKKKTEIFWKD